MKRALIVAAALALEACNPTKTTPAPKTTPALPIEPSSLSTLEPVDLPTLVLAAMPTAGTRVLGWEHMLQAPIRWSTDGFTTTETGAKIRDGWARVRVNGRVSTVLKQGKEELPWTVELDSTANENYGPQEISIKAGGNDENQCFGSLYDNCTFTAVEAFQSPVFKTQFLCQVGPLNDYKRYYMLTASGRAAVVAAYEHDEGSGGVTTELTLTLASNHSPSGLSDAPPECASKSG